MSAIYDAATHTVTLKLKRHVNLHVDYTLKINGVGRTAVSQTRRELCWTG